MLLFETRCILNNVIISFAGDSRPESPEVKPPFLRSEERVHPKRVIGRSSRMEREAPFHHDHRSTRPYPSHVATQLESPGEQYKFTCYCKFRFRFKIVNVCCFLNFLF